MADTRTPGQFKVTVPHPETVEQCDRMLRDAGAMYRRHSQRGSTLAAQQAEVVLNELLEHRKRLTTSL